MKTRPYCLELNLNVLRRGAKRPVRVKRQTYKAVFGLTLYRLSAKGPETLRKSSILMPYDERSEVAEEEVFMTLETAPEVERGGVTNESIGDGRQIAAPVPSPR